MTPTPERQAELIAEFISQLPANSIVDFEALDRQRIVLPSLKKWLEKKRKNTDGLTFISVHDSYICYGEDAVKAGALLKIFWFVHDDVLRAQCNVNDIVKPINRAHNLDLSVHLY